MRADWQADAGTQVPVGLPGVEGTVMARVVRCSGGHLALTFGQDEATQRRVDRAIAHIGSATMAAAA